MRHAYHETPRERQVEAARLHHARDAILNNWERDLIAQHTATRQLRDAGLFEVEIEEALA